jgi:energy-coupling factor transporter ATP-binding protein EcfA2
MPRSLGRKLGRAPFGNALRRLLEEGTVVRRVDLNDRSPPDASTAPGLGAHRWDVFLSHSSADRASVSIIARQLRDQLKLRPFLDQWHLTPGEPWQEELVAALEDSATAAVFIGPGGINPWHDEEVRVALSRAVRTDDEFRVIPVLLPGVDAAQVPTLLSRRTWVDFGSGLDDDEALQRLAAGIRGEAIYGCGDGQLDAPNPYRGLNRFEESDAAIFFGRSVETRALLHRLDQRRLVAVVGASGSGKSSLVRAGLLPALRDGPVVAGNRWRVMVCSPGDDPLRALARQVAMLTHAKDRMAMVDGLVDRFRSQADGLRTAIGDATANDPYPVLIVVDQFEELFSACPHESRDLVRCRDTAAALAANLADAVTKPAGQVRVVITLRADFLDRALNVPGMQPLLADPLLLGPMDEAALREAIAAPAQQVGAIFEKGLVATILRDVQDRDGALPLLQHALLELWKQRRGPWLTIDAYERIGGMAGALRRRAEATYQSLTAERREVARGLLPRLVTYGEGVADTRRRVARDELYLAAVDRSDIDTVIDVLSSKQARLVIADHDTVELTHEALLTEWDRLRGWLDADRDAQRVHRRLTHASAEWSGPLERDPGGLYRGARLAEATEWALDNRERMNLVEAEFLQASQHAATDELARERNRTQRLRRRLHATIAALAITVVAVAAAPAATQRAQANLVEAAPSPSGPTRTLLGRWPSKPARSPLPSLSGWGETPGSLQMLARARGDAD